MIDVVADLHLHSKYSRAVSPQMTPQVMAAYARQKGLDILATGDWTHPIWFRELRSQLEASEEGLYKLKVASRQPQDVRKHAKADDQGPMTSDKEVRYLLSVEIACIYSQGGKGRRIHNLVFVPSFETAEKVTKELLKRGFNLSSDGRPIIGLSSKNLLQLLLEIDERNLLIPAHVWTPWFGIYGQMSGFNSLTEAFEELAPYVYGIETGLSSDPEMNWHIDELQTRSILSFSDAHSPAKMGREATVFRLESLSYENIRKAIMRPMVASRQSQVVSSNTKDQRPTTNDHVLYTVEFYPEEGKYHYSGHRNCGITMTPKEQAERQSICPVCKRKVTDGVMRRVQELSENELSGMNKVTSKIRGNDLGLKWITSLEGNQPPFVRLVPLLEIIAESLDVPVGSPKAKILFDTLCESLDSELFVLLKAQIDAITKAAIQSTSIEKAQKVAEGVKKVREAQIVIQPGYDGVYGVVKIWSEENKDKGSVINDKAEDQKSQMGLEF